MNLANQIDYTENGIVSKILMKETSGSLTLFAFDKGQSLSPHQSPLEAYICLLEGKARITIGDSVHELQAGESVSLPTGIDHAVEALEPFKMLLFMLAKS